MKVDKKLLEGITPEEFEEIATLLLQLRFVVASTNLILDANKAEVRNKMEHIAVLSDKIKVLAEYMRNYSGTAG